MTGAHQRFRKLYAVERSVPSCAGSFDRESEAEVLLDLAEEINGFAPDVRDGEALAEETGLTGRDRVVWVQRSLNRVLGTRLAEDGRLGPQTRSAVRSFQQRKGLKVDGIVGAETERALIASGAGAPSRTTARAQQAPGAGSSACGNDVAITDALAMIFSDRVPMPVLEKNRRRATQDGLRDYHAVAAWMPPASEDRLLMYFHGNNNYVTMAASGDVPRQIDASGHSRSPRWADDRARRAARSKRSALFSYGLNGLDGGQARLASSLLAGRGGSARRPLVLVPEDAELRTPAEHASFWAVPQRGQYGRADDGRPTGPGTPALRALVADCFGHLTCLAKPSGRPYLPSGRDHLNALRRLYLCGHSGGGKPLVEAAGSNLTLPVAGNPLANDGRGVDLWLFDCTYGFGTHNYVNFCRASQATGRLGHAANKSRLVCVYEQRWPKSATETEADILRGGVARLLGVPADRLRHQHTAGSLTQRSVPATLLNALYRDGVVFIRTLVRHDQIPTTFIPLLLRTAAS